MNKQGCEEMKLKNRWNVQEKGVTLIEVVICMVIVSVIVGPLCAVFTTSNKTRQTAARVEETTCYAERLIADLKDQITKDMLLMQKEEGNRVEALSSEEQSRYDNYCNHYLKGSALGSGDEKLQDFLEMDEAAFNAGYNTKQYTYEVVMWPLSKAPISSGGGIDKLQVNTATINDSAYQAVKLYSSNQEAYQFKSDFYDDPSMPISFKVEKEVLRAFQDESKKFIPNLPTDTSDQRFSTYGEQYVVLNTLRLKVKDESNPLAQIEVLKGMDNPKDNGCTKIGQEGIKVIKSHLGQVEGFEIFIHEDDTKAKPDLADSSKQSYLGIVQMDLTGILRNVDDEALYRDYTFKIINQTGYDQMVQVIRNESSLGEEQFPLFFILKDEENGSHKGKSYLQTISDITTEENYIIAVIIRDQSPLVGKKGKIIKKMLDLYSYDPTISTRR